MGDFTVKTIFSVAFSCRQVCRDQVQKIIVQDIVRFYGVMLNTSIETSHLGGYEGYLKPTLYVRVGRGYNVKPFGYGRWVERIMTLARFLQII